VEPFARPVGAGHFAFIVAVVTVSAFVVSGDVAVIPEALLVGSIVGGVHLLVGRGLARVLPVPEVPSAPAERAGLTRPYLLRWALRWALTGVVLTAGVLAYAFAVEPSVLGAVYLLLPVLLLVVLVVIVLRRARD